jgi:Icc-related predicted phosphoesterase
MIFMEKLTKREKVMLGVSIVSLGVAGYFGFKYLDSKNLLKLKSSEMKDIKEDLNFLKFLVVESECVPKALQNAHNKLSRIQNKILSTTERLLIVPGDKDAQKLLESLKAEEAKLIEHIGKTIELDKAVQADEIIYAK